MPEVIANIVFDLLTIACAFIAVLVSISVFVMTIFRKTSTTQTRTVRLLSLNMYANLFINCCIMLDIYCHALYGHTHVDVSFDGPWCHIEAYLFHISSSAFFNSYLLQAIYWVCRIAFYTNPSLQSLKVFIFGIVIQWISSCLQVLPIILFKLVAYQPDDYHCLLEMEHTGSILTGFSCIQLLPVLLTGACYVFTLIYIRKTTERLQIVRHLATRRRDFLVFTRIFILLGMSVAAIMPTFIISLFSRFSQHISAWFTQFQWFTTTLALCCVSILLLFVSPNLKTFWKWQR